MERTRSIAGRLLRRGAWLPLFLALVAYGCGSTSEESEGTRFEPPDWLTDVSYGGGTTGVPGSGGGGSGGAGTSFYGLQVEIPGVAEPLIVPERQTTINETAVNRVISAVGVADDGQRSLTLSFSFLAAENVPAVLDLTIGPLTPGEAVLAYAEALTDQGPNPITSIVRGRLEVDRWDGDRVEGRFSAEIYLQDGARRTLQEGVFRVRRQTQ